MIKAHRADTRDSLGEKNQRGSKHRAEKHREMINAHESRHPGTAW
jgi:hypothetical protein